MLLDQNVEARFYGLYMLAVAVTVDLYTRLVARPVPTRALLVLTFFSQAALVLTHVLGLIYSGLILLALILYDVAKGRLRFKIYLVYAAGWLVLLVWLPAIRASMAAGRPHGWIAMPTLTDLRTAYLFADSLPWLRLFKRHSLEVLFQIVSHAVELLIYIPLAVVFLLGLRRISKSGWRSRLRSEKVLSCFSRTSCCLRRWCCLCFLTSSHRFSFEVFSAERHRAGDCPGRSANALGSDSLCPRRLMPRVTWAAIVVFLMISPVLTVLAVGPIDLSLDYLDVPRLEKDIPVNNVVVAGWQEDFVKLMRFARKPEAHYYFLMDWPAALAGPRDSCSTTI